MYFQPFAYRNTGRPTTNHTSRDPNKKMRAAEIRLTARLLANNLRWVDDPAEKPFCLSRRDVGLRHPGAD
jgi:hypothetical protein